MLHARRQVSIWLNHLESPEDGIEVSPHCTVMLHVFFPDANDFSDWRSKAFPNDRLSALCRAPMVREGKLSEVGSLSELGIYGTFLRRGDDVLFNKEAGHLVRTKVRNSTLLIPVWLLYII